MFEFLKKIFRDKEKEITFVLFEEEEPGASSSYKFRPAKIWMLFYSVLTLLIIIIILFVMFTPLGSLIGNGQDRELRSEVIKISKKVKSLKDSLDARSKQLSEIKQVLATGSDTTFQVSRNFEEQLANANSSEISEQNSSSEVNAYEMISQNEIISSGFFKSAPEFPAFYPVDGTLTRGYQPEKGHFGIDIATKTNATVNAIADGSIINEEWTINYGYVLHIQHGNGIISIYKHLTSLTKSVGDIVLKGDILGTVGNTGVLSSGPHLHLEIWRNGAPQNPNSYLTKP